MNDIQKNYNQLLIRYDEILKENESLKALLRSHGISYVGNMFEQVRDNLYSCLSVPAINLSLDDRVRLFQSYFNGREDVFARRWFSKATGKSGYQPVCKNEWRQNICDKKNYKCADCPNRYFASLTYMDVYRHLEGKDENCCDVIGLYPIMMDNKCVFLCTDFDDKSCTRGYKDDVLAYVGVCKEWNVPYAIERSRSGNGAHVWIFFDSPIPAYKARRLGNAILTEAMNREGRMSFQSYDRFFPNQDQLPDGGLGNLVALPLQGKARRNLNSVFVDERFLAYKDQWSYLHSVKKVQEVEVDRLLEWHIQEELGALTTSSERKPWVTPTQQKIGKDDFYGKLIITKADKIYIPLKAVSAKVLNHLKRIASFKNPAFYSRQAMRFSTYSVPRIISCFSITDDYLAMPRGCWDAIEDFLTENNVMFDIIDETNHGNHISASFRGEERKKQLDAISAMLAHYNGVLHATTAFGKTVTAAAMIARKQVNTLILVHSRALLAQWYQRLAEFLDIDCEEPEQPKRRGRKKVFSPIGCLDSTGNTLHGIIDIALIQSCLDKSEVKQFVQEYGMVIVDECHHVSSVTFENVLNGVKAQCVYGLTATPIRKDGHQPIMFMQCGPIRYSADVKSQMESQSFERYVIPRFTSYRSLTDKQRNISSIYESLVEDEIRNNLIIGDVLKAVGDGRTPIILTNRKSHVTLLTRKLSSQVRHVVALTGSGAAKEKREVLQRLQNISSEEPLVIIATGKYIGEGFDYPKLDTLFLAVPISWKGLVAQYAGRLHREYAGKKDVRIYDYIDIHEPVCDSMYRKRLKGYAAIGYKILAKDQTSLFAESMDADAVAADEYIFNGLTFRHPFLSDLKRSRNIIISSPRLYKVEQNALFNKLCDYAHNGIDIVIITASESDATEYIRTRGLMIKVVPTVSLCASIIDKSVVWYGSINILGYISKDDNMIRVEDSSLASDLVRELFSGDDFRHD